MQEKHKQQALRYLNVRMRSELEMRLYLKKKQISTEEIDEIIQYLYHYKYLDDESFAESFVRDKLRFHPCGRNKLIYALKEKGINEFIIEDVMEKEFTMEDEWKFLMNDYKKCQSKDKTYQQTMRYLYSKGYSTALLSRLERY